ncbi:MAG: A/G-specific adenine glycosylase [Planctomycetota bacterium]
MSPVSGVKQKTPEKKATTPIHDAAWRQSKWRAAVRRKLLRWFDQNARELPWRSDPQPYHVWVSEIMLQQTQVATVLPYYARWLRAFPNVLALAHADEADLMRHWEGLGYYRRVRSMHAAAKKIVADHGGEFPLEYDQVLALPGIGRYTAGAILSISSDARLPILEGNTQRVFSRLIGLREHPTEKNANALLWDVAAKMLPRSGCGIFNQAAMELGALVCQPNPKCDECPLMTHCSAAETGSQQEIPGKIKKIRYEDKHEFALIVRRDRSTKSEYLVRPLPDGERWAGLWDFPRPTHFQTQTADDVCQWLGTELNRQVHVGPRLQTIRHAVTKYRIQLDVHQATLAKPLPTPRKPWQWASLESLAELPLSTTGRKIADALARRRQPMLPALGDDRE